ncbi:hypothetical protein TWF694_004352 [Orbilia ellipsospora]|uniref:Ubiquitin-like-conjugating enzyme ATG10 n=1 Tax=Orbilia ellipsospora TaxID=2528407 RepID=A0AAV9WZ67_9PEZI
MATSSEDGPSSSLSLPFLSNATFSIAMNHFIEHLNAHSTLKYEIRRSPYDDQDVYLEIVKFISAKPTSDGAASNKDMSDEIDEIEIDLEDAEDNPESLPPLDVTTMQMQTHKITYHILLSPIYSVPVLYFIGHSVDPFYGNTIHSLDEIHALLVPDSHRSTLSSIGIQGGISQTHHPYLGTTSWFIHPCRTAEALKMWMEDGNLGLENYMGVWVGSVGAVVGLVV